MYFAHYDDGEHLINNEATKSFFIVRAWSTKVSLLKPSGITMLSRCEAVEAVWAPASILSISSMNLTEEESQVMVSSAPQQSGSCNIQTMKLETRQHNTNPL